MELIFTKQADRWVAEFIANNDFNLHIEGVVEGNVSLFQRGSESGNYAFVKDGTPHPSYANVYDYDFAALIYPKFIKVSCATEPTSGIVTSNGEITEIKAQSKEIEVTSNGTTEVTPDAGFSYLNSVKVKTNVAQSGGGGTPLSKDMIYLDLSGYTVDDKTNITNGVVLCAKYIDDNGSVNFVSPMLFALTDRSIWKKMNYFAVCGSLLVKDYEGNIVPLIDMINLSFPDIPRLTESEFYNLNA